MKILAIESSCDETSAAVYESETNQLLSNVIFTQMAIHAEFGGVVPEVASRSHIEKITYVIDEALLEAKVKLEDISAVAVTKEPGLVGSLMVGINAAKSLALVLNCPLIEVNHLHGHIYANALEHELVFPALALVVSGGHTELVLMKDHYNFEKLGETLDDAVGEAYDKVARVLGIGYPGGPIIDKLAKLGQNTYPLPLVRLSKDSFDFSFSGIKSAVLNLKLKETPSAPLRVNDVANSFQEAVTTVLVEKTVRASLANRVKMVILAGGVAANSTLRKKMADELGKISGVSLVYPSLKLCGDNAGMIACAAAWKVNHQSKN